MLLDSEPACGHFLRELRAFVGPRGADTTDPAGAEPALTPAEREVLGLVARGLEAPPPAGRRLGLV